MATRTSRDDVDTVQKALAEIERRRREDPLGLVYKPHEGQKLIHKDRHDITLVVAANRVGKTMAACAEACYYAFGRPTWAEVPEPPNEIAYVMPSLPMFRRAIIPKMKQLLPPGEWENYNKSLHVLPLSNGSTIHFLSADMRQRRLQGSAFDLVVMDEAMDREIYGELQARVITTRGRILIVLTPVDEDASKWMWIRDELYTPSEIGERPDIKVIKMAITDGEGHSLVPHLNDEDIRKMEMKYPDPRDRATRMYGEFVVRHGLVFQQYEPAVHLIEPFEIPDNFHRWLICDPQYYRFGVLMFAADDWANYYVTDEYFSQEEPLARRAEHIAAMVGQRDRQIPMYVDYANPQEVMELNYHFSRVGAPIGAMPLPIRKDISKMLLRVHSMLEPSEKRNYHPVTGMKQVYGAPRLMFFDNLESVWTHNDRVIKASRLVWELKRLTWGKNGKPDKDSAGGADLSDCLAYGCSIVATGHHPKDTDDWREDLSERDVQIYEAIRRLDQRQRQGPKEWAL